MTSDALQHVQAGNGVTHLSLGKETVCGLAWATVVKSPLSCPACVAAVKDLDRELKEQEARIAWTTGDLGYKLDPVQLDIAAKIDAAWAPRKLPAGATEEERLKAIPPAWYYLLLARGFGKSVLCCVRALMKGRRQKDARIYYAAPEKKDALDIVRDTVELKLLADCPKELRPVWSPSESLYNFPGTGAVWRIKGVNSESADTLRGPGAHLFVLDEMGGMDHAEYVVRSVVDPMITRDGWHGNLLVATTPAKEAGHGSQEIFRECVNAGVASKHTLLENNSLSWEDKARAMRSCGEKDADIPAILAGKMLPRTTTARREYFCMFVVDGASAVHPDWPDLEPELTVRVERG